MRGQVPPRWSMSEERSRPIQVGGTYPFAEMVKAFQTAVTHDDPVTREWAGARMERWKAVLDGMASGRLQIGSRTPVAGFPAWVTPEVVRGGFATGRAAAAGELLQDERALAARLGVEETRAAVFEAALTPDGLEHLEDVLRQRAYRVDVPESAALLVLVWLVRAGDLESAAKLLVKLRPFAARLRFLPLTAVPDDRPPEAVFRVSAGDAQETLRQRREHERLAKQREAVTVWAPFADELLAHWLETAVDGRIAADVSSEWVARSRELLQRYEQLAAVHVRCTKHRRPKENLAILRSSLEVVAGGEALGPRRRGLLQHAVDSMVARRGVPGSPEHRAARAAQLKDVSAPDHRVLARIAAARLGRLRDDRGTPDPEALAAPVTADEAPEWSVPALTPMPPSVVRTLRRTKEGPLAELVRDGVVPSAEVLAALVPRLAAAGVAAAYADPDLQHLVADHYEAFRRRRSLLLLDLEHQVRVDELPWVRVLAAHRDEAAAPEAVVAFAHVAELALEAFPSTLTPSPLVTEFEAFAVQAGLDLPWVEELAADIFMGRFSRKFLRAAQLAGRLLKDSLYSRYYGIDYSAVLGASADTGRRATADFDRLCRARAEGGDADGWSVAANGTIIEQAQILTTHNLATLLGPFGVGEHLQLDSQALALRCFRDVVVFAGRLTNNKRPLPMVKDAAYGWRQMLFFLSLLDDDAQASAVARIEEELRSSGGDAGRRLQPAVEGLVRVARGERFGRDGRVGDGRQLLGWTTDRHWMLEV